MSVVWTGDLEDDCTAYWHDLILRAERMEMGVWWWQVLRVVGTQISEDGEARAVCEEVSSVDHGYPWPSTGVQARMAADAAARKFMEENPL